MWTGGVLTTQIRNFGHFGTHKTHVVGELLTVRRLLTVTASLRARL